MIVLNPNQWNFEMAVDVEVHATRPSPDKEDWEQVSEGYLAIDSNGVLQLDSPEDAFASCAVAPGKYIVEVSGRGFFTDNRLGTDAGEDGGDVWRVRLWPDDGSPLDAPKVWQRPAPRS